MRKFIWVVLFLTIPVVCFAQDAVTGDSVKEEEEKEPVYIPQDLEECFVELNKVLSKENIEAFRNKKEEEIIDYHFGLGMWIRNNWELSRESRLAKYFQDLGISHPDDMSTIILNAFHRHLNNKEIKLEEQVGHYQRCREEIEKEDMKR